MRSFSLLRYFTAASLAVIVGIALATGWSFSLYLERSLVEEAGFYAEDVAASLNRAVFEEFLRPLQLRGETIDLERPEQLRALDEVVASRTQGLRILTVILFDSAGTIIYATNPSYIGHRSQQNPGLASALAGEPQTLLKRAELEQDAIRPGHDLIETYTPFFDLAAAPGAPAQVIAVLEIYQDARRITREIRQGRQRIALATAGLMGLLFLLLFEIVRRGDVRIRELTRALEAGKLELEERVRVRTGEIERARERLQSLFDGIADGISVIDEQFRVVDANAAQARAFGPRESPPARCYARWAGRDAPCPRCPALETLRSGARAEHRDRWRDAAGRERDVEITTFPYTTADQRKAVIEVVRDVTERSELERQVLQSESLAALGELAAGVAHEVRNPLGMIASAAQLLESADALSARDRELLEVVRAETSRLNATVSEFVNFAAPPRPSPTATDAAALLERTATLLRAEAERRKITLEVAVAASLPRFRADPELLFRALANLALNALQVQQEGGWVGLRARHEPGAVVLEVADHGPGIAEEDVARVFQPFFTRRAGGTGLGLSIVQRIVAAHDGRIRVSTSPQGTTFTLAFAEAA